jgi:hypothetical protein
MHPELDNLVKALDALQVARSEDIPRLRAVYESLLDDVATARKLNRDLLESAVIRQHRAWLRAQQKPSSMPKKA